MRDFYSTMAQVFPVLMLALVWESAYLDRLRTQARHRGRVRFWTKSRVRSWTIAISTIAIVAVALAALVLAGIVPDSALIRVSIVVGLLCVLGTILTRAVVDIVEATDESPTRAQRRD
ncbi:hypothetical protein [Krasilnikovia sp. M28-CT-15]|uniref:hypothetical protein n=1 Tax=Krasilnikovia sp. M28-CT-15 TaxID=3373540 RepID=UPI00387614B0